MSSSSQISKVCVGKRYKIRTKGDPTKSQTRAPPPTPLEGAKQLQPRRCESPVIAPAGRRRSEFQSPVRHHYHQLYQMNALFRTCDPVATQELQRTIYATCFGGLNQQKRRVIRAYQGCGKTTGIVFALKKHFQLPIQERLDDSIHTIRIVFGTQAAKCHFQSMLLFADLNIGDTAVSLVTVMEYAITNMWDKPVNVEIWDNCFSPRETESKTDRILVLERPKQETQKEQQPPFHDPYKGFTITEYRLPALDHVRNQSYLAYRQSLDQK